MYNFIKRFLDILFSSIALLVLLPIFIPIVIILLLTGEHEVFYFQKRIGHNNRYFHIWKFATMLKNSPNIGTGYITTRNDPRVLPFGQFLRKTKLNELPQLINILKGDMSIIGPRPMVDKTFEAFPESIRYEIYSSRPGLSGIGSVIFRDEEEYVSRAVNYTEFYNQIIQPYKAELELWYGKNKNLTIDFKIIFLTVWAILSPKNQSVYKLFKNLPYCDLEQALVNFNNANS
ncbi:MAG: sugar transferase [Prevotellaceae bacterium]|jgi:lipopolysaccharide/colanic/teichoic acid biosynthesis glycosyltransferase|nr:sugar transferase [Prevotellaceae bacterium]